MGLELKSCFGVGGVPVHHLTQSGDRVTSLGWISSGPVTGAPNLGIRREPLFTTSASAAAISAATRVAHEGTARHRPVVEWAGQSTNNPTEDPRGPTGRSEGRPR